MPYPVASFRYQRSPLQEPYDLKDAYDWGKFVTYLELGDDGFATRQVNEYENDHLTRYDRAHWNDQFGSLADFRFGDLWVKYWGEPIVISREEFERKWQAAGASHVAKLRQHSPSSPPPWL